MRKSIFTYGLCAFMVLGIFTVSSTWAEGNCGCNQAKAKKNGLFMQSRGENLASPKKPAEVKSRLFNQEGEDIGYVHSILNFGVDTAKHTFVLKDGSTLVQVIKNEIALPILLPIDDAAVAAIPELAPYQGVRGAELLVVVSNQQKDSPLVVSWESKGPRFKGLNTFDVRCAFLLVKGRVTEILECSYNFRP